MSIFDELQADFVEQGKYCKLLVGPPVDKEGFEQVEVVDEYFGTIGYVTRLIQVEEISTPSSNFVESIVNAIEDAKSVLHEMADSTKGMTLLERNLMKTLKATAPVSAKLYIVEGASDLVNLDEIQNQEPIEMEQTISIPAIEEEITKPCSVVAQADVELTLALPITTDTPQSGSELKAVSVAENGNNGPKDYTDTFFDPALTEDDGKIHIIPRKHIKLSHKKNSVTGLLPRITGRAA